MSLIVKKIFIFVSVVVMIAGISMGTYWLYDKYLKKSPELRESLAQTFTPGPLLSALDTAGAADNLDPSEILHWTNYYREQEGLNDLTMDDTLSRVALEKANDMFENQYFEHESPAGKDVADLVTEVGYDYALAGENLAMGGYKDEKDLVDAWMASPGHRENILREQYREIGISAVRSEYEGIDTWMSVQTFGTPAPECSMPSSEIDDEIEAKKAEYSELESLVGRYNSLVAEGHDLIERGNAKIREGNKKADDSGDNEAAQTYWDDGRDLQAKGQAKIDKAEAMRSRIEYLQGLHDEIQDLVAQYNLQVENYNSCVNQYNY